MADTPRKSVFKGGGKSEPFTVWVQTIGSDVREKSNLRGDIMSGLFGSKQKTTSSSTPYSGEYKNQAADYYDRILQKINSNVTPYTGQINATTNQTQQNAMQGYNDLTNTQALTDTIGGKYLDPSTNPYLQKYYDQAAGNIDKAYGQQADAYDSKFGANSFWGGSQHQKAYQDMADNKSDALNDLATNIYGGAYNQERSNQMNAINQAGNLYNSQYNIGQSQYGNEQDALGNTYNEWLRQQQQGENDLDRYAQYLSLVKNPSQTQTTSSKPGIGSILFGK